MRREGALGWLSTELWSGGRQIGGKLDSTPPVEEPFPVGGGVGSRGTRGWERRS